ncbi:MAG TPA: DedA family protein [Phenylobacterium sp.]|nr:DedA family protein [Phenylobacterium sp.]
MNLIHLSEFIAQYGYFAVFGLIVFQSLGVPLPGEAALIAAAVYAQHTGRLSILAIVVVAAIASALGSILGYWIGRRGGYPLLSRYGHHIGLNPARMRLGEYLFRIHGGKILLFGRIMAVLRVYEAVLAGTYRMPTRRFMIFNVLGAVIWAAGVGYCAYGFGELFHRMEGFVAWTALGIGLFVLVAAGIYLKRQEVVLQAHADAHLAAEQGV